MVISKKLAHVVQNRLQLIMTYIELGEVEKAKGVVREVSTLLHSRISTDYLKEEWFAMAKLIKPDMTDEEWQIVWNRWSSESPE